VVHVILFVARIVPIYHYANSTGSSLSYPSRSCTDSSFYDINSCLQELEALKNELEDSTNTTAAAEVLRTKREQEVVDLKRSMEDEVRSHEAAIQELRRKHTQQLEEAGEQLDQVRKVVL
jgi:Myosin tail